MELHSPVSGHSVFFLVQDKVQVHGGKVGVLTLTGEGVQLHGRPGENASSPRPSESPAVPQYSTGAGRQQLRLGRKQFPSMGFGHELE